MAALRRACLTTLIALVAQFSLGMILNLYVSVPASDAHAGFIEEIKTAPFGLTVHVLLGIVLIVSATAVLIRAARVRDRPMVTLAITGLTAILGAFAAGEMFVKNGENTASLWMAILTGGALVCYICALGRLSMVPGRRRVGAAPEEYGESEPEPAYAARGYAQPGYAEPVPLPRRAAQPQVNGPWQTGPQRRLQTGYPPTPPWPPQRAQQPQPPQPSQWSQPPQSPQPTTGPIPYRPEPPTWQQADRQWPSGG